MSSLILVGGGGHCLSVLDTICRINGYDEVLILDVVSQIGKELLGYEIIGTDAELPALYRRGYRDAFITVGSITDTTVRKNLAAKVLSEGFNLVNIIDPSAVVSSNITLGKGVFIGKKAVVNAECQISDMAIINTGAIIEHGNRIGAFSHVAVGAVLCGNVSVGCDCLIGANSTVLQGICIGDNSVIGAGSIIYKNVAGKTKIYGGN